MEILFRDTLRTLLCTMDFANLSDVYKPDHRLEQCTMLKPASLQESKGGMVSTATNIGMCQHLYVTQSCTLQTSNL